MLPFRVRCGQYRMFRRRGRGYLLQLPHNPELWHHLAAQEQDAPRDRDHALLSVAAHCACQPLAGGHHRPSVPRHRPRHS